MPGPTPKRSAERRRRNITPGSTTVIREGNVHVPKLSAHTHAIAKGWYASLKTSGQSDFFEPSDWAAAILVAEMITRLLEEEETTASLFAGIWSAMGDLLTTESARRKMRMEVERVKAGEEETAQPTALDDYKSRLGVAK